MNTRSSPIFSFAVNFDLKYDKKGTISFDALINFRLNGRVHKIQTELQIRSSENELMDTICILQPEIDTQVFPTIFYY